MDKIKEIFSCTQCGYCCHGETTVSLNNNDRKTMVQELGVEPELVKQKYWNVKNNVVQMKTEDGHCIFYGDGCLIHRARPWQCRQWPFHPAILLDQANFSAIKASCPGIQAEVTYEKFCGVMKEILNGHEKVSC